MWDPRDLVKGNKKTLGSLGTWAMGWSLWVQLRNSIYMEALILDTGAA